MATHLSRTCDATSGGGYSNKWTWSGWVKRAKLGAEQGIMGNQRTDNNTNSRFKLYFRSTDRLGWECKDSGGSDDSSFETNALFRDSNCWYHICFIYDSDNSTESDRMKCYVNGKDVRTELGGFSSINEVGSGFGTLWSSSVKNYVGTSGNNSGVAMQFDGLMSHVHFTYGQRYEASTFGETDSTTGEWKWKNPSGLTYGSQGFHLLKDNAAVTDQSGEGNDYTATGTLTKTEDNPSNVFASFNNQHNYYEGGTYAYGNNQITTGGSNKYTWNNSTLGMEAGKYYAEFKWVSGGSDILFGITDKFTNSSTGELGNYDKQYAYRTNGTVRNNNGDLSGWSGSSWTTGDVIGVLLDMDNNKLYFSKNGVIQNSSTGISINTSPNDGCYYFSSCGYDDSSVVLQANFGNGIFGTTALTGTTYNGADGNGIFKYDPNSITLDSTSKSFKSLSTKGLNA